MVNSQYDITVGPFQRGFHLITQEVLDGINEWPSKGLLHLFLQHTSAGICINEAADPDVLHDFQLFFDKLAPEHMKGLRHTLEGSDDMPAHIKSVLSGFEITIPIRNSRLALGTWQGIYLCEYRNHASRRHIIATVYN